MRKTAEFPWNNYFASTEFKSKGGVEERMLKKYENNTVS
jgi:hypothetical protein